MKQGTKTPIRKLLLLAAAVGATLFVWRSMQAVQEEAPRANAFFAVKRGDLLISVIEEGALKAASEVVIRSALEGVARIISLAPEGAHVKKGDLLVELDSSDLKDRINAQEVAYQENLFFYLQAEENLKIQKSLVESNIKQAELQVEFAESDLEKFKDGDAPLQIRNAEAKISLQEDDVRTAEERFARTQELFKRGNATKSVLEGDSFSLKRKKIQLEQSRENLRLLLKYDQPNSLRMLEAKVEQAKDDLQRLKQRSAAEIAQSEADLRTSKAALDFMESSLNQQKKQFENTKIIAPQDGLVIYAPVSQFSGRGEGRPDEGRSRMREGGFDSSMSFGGRGFRGDRSGRSRGGGGSSYGSGGTSGGSFSSASPSQSSASSSSSPTSSAGSAGGFSSASSASASSGAASGSSSASGSRRPSSSSGSRSRGSSSSSSGRSSSSSSSRSSSLASLPSSSSAPVTSSPATSSGSLGTGSSFSSTSQSSYSGLDSGWSTRSSFSSYSSSMDSKMFSMGGGSGVLEEGILVRQRQELIKLPDVSRMVAEVKIHESRVRQVHPGMMAYVRVETLPGQRFQGSVRKVAILPDAQVSWASPSLKVYPTEVLIEEALPELHPGVSVRAEIIITNLLNVISVPIQAVVTHHGQHVCYVLNGTTTAPVPVTVGWFNDRFMEIKSGLKEGDHVLLAPPTDSESSEESTTETNAVQAADQPSSRLQIDAAPEGPVEELRAPRPSGVPSGAEIDTPSGRGPSSEAGPGPGRGQRGRRGFNPNDPEAQKRREEFMKLSPEEREARTREFRGNRGSGGRTNSENP